MEEPETVQRSQRSASDAREDGPDRRDARQDHDPAPVAEATMAELMRSHPGFVRIWFGQAVSQAGDWISYVALLALLLELTGSAWTVSLLLVVSTLTTFAVTPVAGVVADRFDRGRVLVTSDLVRMIFSLGLLFIHRPQDVWIAMVVTMVNVAASNFFSPAGAAALPNFVAPRELTAANAVMGATSGIMMAVGAAVGGVVATFCGRPAAFVLDAFSFLVSALTLLSIRQGFSRNDRVGVEAAHTAPAGLSARVAWRDLHESFRYVVDHRPVLAILLLKLGAGVGAGVLPLLSVVPVKIFHAGDGGVSLLYTSRGMGSIMGALVAPRFGNGPFAFKASCAAAALAIGGFFCVAFALAPNLWWAAVFVLLAYLALCVLFVLASAMLQQQVENNILGRVFALDNGGLMLSSTISTLLCGWAVTVSGPRPIGLVTGALLIACGAAWLVWYRWWRPFPAVAAHPPYNEGDSGPVGNACEEPADGIASDQRL